MRLDIYAPIIPFEGLGGIKLYSTRDELKELLKGQNVSELILDNWTRYDIDDSIELFFHKKNNKLFKITTLDNYKGMLFGKIGVNTSEEEMLKAEPTFVYDDFEEVWLSPKGVFIETDAETNVARWITVYIPELFSEDFQECNW